MNTNPLAILGHADADPSHQALSKLIQQTAAKLDNQQFKRVFLSDDGDKLSSFWRGIMRGGGDMEILSATVLQSICGLLAETNRSLALSLSLLVLCGLVRSILKVKKEVLGGKKMSRVRALLEEVTG